MLVVETVFEQASVMKRDFRTRTGKQDETEQNKRENNTILWIRLAKNESAEDIIEGVGGQCIVRKGNIVFIRIERKGRCYEYELKTTIEVFCFFL
jgi:hypothetical protein